MQFVAELASLSTLLRGLFVWSVPALALWHFLARPPEEAWWKKAIRICAFLGASSGIAFLAAWLPSTALTLTGPDAAEAQRLLGRLTGPYAFAYWARMLVLGVLPLLLFRASRRSWWRLWMFAWLLWDPFAQFERFVILVTSFHRDHQQQLGQELFWSFWLLVIPSLLLASAWGMRCMQKHGAADAVRDR